MMQENNNNTVTLVVTLELDLTNSEFQEYDLSPEGFILHECGWLAASGISVSDYVET